MEKLYEIPVEEVGKLALEIATDAVKVFLDQDAKCHGIEKGDGYHYEYTKHVENSFLIRINDSVIKFFSDYSLNIPREELQNIEKRQDEILESIKLRENQQEILFETLEEFTSGMTNILDKLENKLDHAPAELEAPKVLENHNGAEPEAPKVLQNDIKFRYDLPKEDIKRCQKENGKKHKEWIVLESEEALVCLGCSKAMKIKTSPRPAIMNIRKTLSDNLKQRVDSILKES